MDRTNSISAFVVAGVLIAGLVFAVVSGVSASPQSSGSKFARRVNCDDSNPVVLSIPHDIYCSTDYSGSAQEFYLDSDFLYKTVTAARMAGCDKVGGNKLVDESKDGVITIRNGLSCEYSSLPAPRILQHRWCPAQDGSEAGLRYKVLACPNDEDPA